MQKKKINIKKSNSFYLKRKKQIKKKYGGIFNSKRIKVYKPYGNSVLNKLKNSKIFTHRLNINLKFNNIFCTFINIYKNKLLLSRSSGKYNIKTSKKNLKHTFKIILTNFLKDIKKKVFFKSLIISIIAPVRLRKKILIFISRYFRRKNLLIRFKRLKCYNGCRPPKKIRKKRKRLRFFK